MAYVYCEKCCRPFDYPTPQEAADGQFVCNCCGNTEHIDDDVWKDMLIEVVEDFQAKRKAKENE